MSTDKHTGDFIVDISYNKKVNVENGVCYIEYSGKDGGNWAKWLLSRELVVGVLRLRAAIQACIDKSRNSQFGILGTHYVRTGTLTFKGEDNQDEPKFLLFFGTKASSAQQASHRVIVTPEKFYILLDCLQAYMDGVKPGSYVKTCMHSFDDLEEFYRIVFYKLYKRNVVLQLQLICYGCQNQRASQKDHDHCLTGTEEEVQDDVLKLMLREEYAINLMAVLALKVWLDKNPSITLE